MNRVTAIIVIIGFVLFSPILLLLYMVSELGKWISDVYGDGEDWYWGGRE